MNTNQTILTDWHHTINLLLIIMSMTLIFTLLLPRDAEATLPVIGAPYGFFQLKNELDKLKKQYDKSQLCCDEANQRLIQMQQTRNSLEGHYGYDNRFNSDSNTQICFVDSQSNGVCQKRLNLNSSEHTGLRACVKALFANTKIIREEMADNPEAWLALFLQQGTVVENSRFGATSQEKEKEGVLS